MEERKTCCALKIEVQKLINRFVPGRGPDITVKMGFSKLEIKCHKHILLKSPVIKSWLARCDKTMEIIRADEIVFLHAIAILYSGKSILHQQNKHCVYVDLMAAYLELPPYYTPNLKKLHLFLQKETRQIIDEALKIGSDRPNIVPCILQSICRTKHNSVDGTIAVEKGGRNGKPRVVIRKYGLGDPTLVTVHQIRGLSLNCLQHFCVDHRGVTLISYDVHTIVIKCPLGAIDTILCGWIQIAWPDVHLVICNPSGITIDDVTFHNAKRLTLTTGEVSVKQGVLKFFVTEGTVTICGRGIDLQNLKNVNIYSKNFVAGATISTPNLKIVTGKNIVEVIDDDDIDVVQFEKSDVNQSMVSSPEFQVHKRVCITCDEMVLIANGCANNDGNIFATYLDFSVTGTLRNGKGGSIRSFQSSLFNVTQKWDNYGQVSSKEKVTINASTFESYEGSYIQAPIVKMQNDNFTSQGTLGGALITMDVATFNLGPSAIVDCDGVVITAKSVENEGRINSFNAVDITANELRNFRGSETVADDVTIVCTSMTNDSVLQAKNTLNVVTDKLMCCVGSQIFSSKASIKAKDLIQNDGALFGGIMKFRTHMFDNNIHGNIAAEHVLISNSDILPTSYSDSWNTTTALDDSRDLNIAAIVKNSGNIEARKSLNIQSKQLHTVEGSHTKSDDEILLDTYECIISGHIASTNKVMMRSDIIKNLRSGLVLTDNLQIRSAENGCFINDGKLVALSIEAVFSPNEQSRDTISGATFCGFFNRGKMSAEVIKLSGNRMENEQGANVSTRTMEVQLDRQNSVFKNEGAISAEVMLRIDTALFTNSEFGSIESANLIIDCGEKYTTAGKLRAINLDIKSPILDILTGSVDASKSNFTAKKILNEGRLVQHQLNITTDMLQNNGSIDNSRGSINATKFINTESGNVTSADITINCTENCTTSGKVRAGNIRIEASVFEIAAGSVEAEITNITVNDFCNKATVLQNYLNIFTNNLRNSGIIEANSGVINSDEFVNNSAINVGNFSFKSNRFKNNVGSTINAERSLIQSNNLFENDGIVNSEVASIITNTFNNNKKGIVEGKTVTIDCNSSIHNNGNISADYNLDLKSKDYHPSAQSVTSSGGDMSLHLDSLANPARIVADTNLHLFVQNIENNATIASRNGTVSVTSNSFQNDGIIVGRTTKVDSNRNLINKGTLRAIGSSSSLELSSATIDNNCGGVITARNTKINGSTRNAGLIHGTDICNFSCSSVRNTDGALIDAGVLNLKTEHVENPKNGVIAARTGIEAQVNSFDNSESALVYSNGYFHLSGLSSTKAISLTNIAGTIDIQGDANLSVNNFRQRNSNFSTMEVLVSQVHVVEDRPPNRENYTHYDFVRTIHETRIATTSPAKLYVGGKLHLDTDNVENDKSHILAGNIIGRMNSIRTLDHHGNRTITDEGTSQSTWTQIHKGGRRFVVAGPRKKKKVRHWSRRKRHYARRPQRISLNAALTEDRSPPILGSNATVVAYKARHEVYAKEWTIVDHLSSQGRPIVRKIEFGGCAAPMLDISTLLDNGLYSVMTNHCQKCHTSTHVPAPLVHLDCRLVTQENKILEESLALPSSSANNLPSRFDLNFEKKLIRKQVWQCTGKILLSAYSSDDDQIVGLTMNGRNVKGLTIGAELTNEQIDSLEQNILWMVRKDVKLSDGNVIEALIPQVYILATTVRPDILMGIPNSSIVSANRIDLTVTDSFVNEGVWNSNNINLNANTVLNRKGIINAESMNIYSRKDITNESGIILADKVLTLNADRDLNIITNTETTSDPTATVLRTDVDSIATIYVTSNDGELNLNAGRNVNTEAAQIGNAGEQSIISAGNDINLGTVKVGKKENIVWDENSRFFKEESRDIGSVVKVAGNLNCRAVQDLNITATSICAGQSSDRLCSVAPGPGTIENIGIEFSKDISGKLELAAGRNINILSGEDACNLDEEHTSTHEFTFSGSTVYTRKQLMGRGAVGSSLIGNNISAVANQDIRSEGTVIRGMASVNLEAGNNIDLVCAQSTASLNCIRNEETESVFSDVSTLDTTRKESTTIVATTLECSLGDVSLIAGGNYCQSGSQIYSNQGNVAVDASRIDIVNNENEILFVQKHEMIETGLVFGCSSSITEGIQSIQQMDSDVPLTYATASLSAFNTGEAIVDNVKTLGGANLSVTFGTTCFETEQTGHHFETQPSIIQAKQNVSLRSTNDDVKLKGSQIIADGVVNINSINDVNILAGFDEHKTRSRSTSSTTGIGISAGVNSGISVNMHHRASSGRGNFSGRKVSNAVIQGSGINIKSSKDTNVVGGKIVGTNVDIEVGRNFNMKSVQDYESITNSSHQFGVGLSYQIGTNNIVGNFQKSIGEFSSSYNAVNEKTAIISDCFNINVNGNTHLQGADILSHPLETKAFLSTKSLTVSDIENTTNYSAQQSGINISFDMNAFTPQAGCPYVASMSEEDHKITKSHVSNARNIVQIANVQPETASLLAELSETSDDETPLENRFYQDKIQRQMEASLNFTHELNKFVSNRVRNIDKKETEAKHLENVADDMENSLTQEKRSALLERVNQLNISASKDRHLWGAGGIARQICLAVGAAATSTTSLSTFAQYAATHFAQQKVAQEIGELVSRGIQEESDPLHFVAHAATAYVGAAFRGENCMEATVGAVLSTLIPQFFRKATPQLLETESMSDRNLNCTAVVAAASFLFTNASLSSCSTSAVIAADNNWLSSRQIAQYKRELAAASTFEEKIKVEGRWIGVRGKQFYFLANGLTIGLLKGGIDDIKGIANILQHPVEAIRGIKQLLSNSSVRAELGVALLSSLKSKLKAIEFALLYGEGDSDAEKLGKDFGELIYHVGTTCVGVFGLTKGASKMTIAGLNFGKKALRSVKSLNINHVERLLEMVVGTQDHRIQQILNGVKLRKYRAFQIQNKAVFAETMGEKFIKTNASHLGPMKQIALKQGPGHNGIDAIFEFGSGPNAKYILVEYKYGSSQLKLTTKHGKQMSDTWVRPRIKKALPTDLLKADKLLKDFDSGNITKLLVRVNEAGDVTLHVLDECAKKIKNAILPF